MNKQLSIYNHIVAPAPRYLMRLAILEKMFRRYISGENKRFLEIGPGLGDICSYLMSHPSVIEGLAIERSGKAANIIGARLQDDERFSVLCADLMDVGSGSFDYVLSFEVLEHIGEDVRFIQLVANRIAPSGYWFISVPAYMKKWQKQDEFSGHVRRYERDEIAAKLRQAGLEVVELIDYGFPLTSLMRPFRDKYYKKDNSQSNLEKTLESGTEHRAFNGMNPRFMLALLYPFIVAQQLFAPLNLGDGFIAVARKKAG